MLVVFNQFTMKHVCTDANISCSISRRIVIDMQGWIPSHSDIDMATQSALCKTSFTVSMPRDPVVIGCTTSKYVYLFCKAPQCMVWCARYSRNGIELASDLNCAHIDDGKRIVGYDVNVKGNGDNGKGAVGDDIRIGNVDNGNRTRGGDIIDSGNIGNRQSPTRVGVIQQLVSMKWTRGEWLKYVSVHSSSINKKQLLDMQPYFGVPSLKEIGSLIIDEVSASATLHCVSATVSRKGQGLLMNWEIKNSQSLGSGNQWQAWHGTSLPFLASILESGRLLPGPTDPDGVFCHKEQTKDKAWFYAPACCVSTDFGVWMSVLIRVNAAGKWGREPPKTVRRDQWFTQEAVVTGVTCELFGSQSFHLGDGIIDLSNIINTSVSLPMAISTHRQSAEHLLPGHVLVDKELHDPRPSQSTSILRYGKPLQSMMNVQHDVVGEKESRDFLMINGWGGVIARHIGYHLCEIIKDPEQSVNSPGSLHFVRALRCTLKKMARSLFAY